MAMVTLVPSANKAIRRAPPATLPAKAATITAEYNAIIATAGKHRCDLIVMASHGRRGIKRLLLGSETQQVLTHATTAVLVLR